MDTNNARRALLGGAALGVVAALAVFPAASCNQDAGPCDGVGCSGQGLCRVATDGQTPYCVCYLGFHPSGAGAGCEANAVGDPCSGVTCSGHGACTAVGTLPTCTCDDGWVPDESTLSCFPRGGADADADADSAADADADDGGVPPTPGKVDLVFMVDNSGSMSQEQAALIAHFPELLLPLLDPPDSDGDTHPDRPPVNDLNIGVISSDMGTMGFAVPTCSRPAGGDNGCFHHAPGAGVGECAATFPPFLARNEANAAAYSADQMAHDFACIATLGTSGCGFEQPLKAMRQALTVDAVPPAGCNQGFLRDDSVLALVWVTDEEDCSVSPEHPEMFDIEADLGHLNIRCYLHPDFVERVDDYVSWFRALRGGRADGLVLGMIVGVPPEIPGCIGPGDALGSCLAVPAMQEQIDPANPTTLLPSCNTDLGYAFPPRRFVQLAQAFGAQAYVDSICKSDWSSAMEGIASRFFR